MKAALFSLALAGLFLCPAYAEEPSEQTCKQAGMRVSYIWYGLPMKEEAFKMGICVPANAKCSKWTISTAARMLPLMLARFLGWECDGEAHFTPGVEKIIVPDDGTLG